MILRYLLIGLLIGNVFLKLFTNYLRVLPKVLNIFDVIVVALFLLLFIYNIGSIRKLRFSGILVGLIFMDLIFLVGAALNPAFLHPPAAVSQVIMLNEPILLFFLLVNLPFTLKDLNAFNKVLYGVILIQLVLGVLQLPLYIFTGESESILGTFYHNAEQYVGFMLLGAFFMLGRSEVNRSKRTFYYIIILSITILILIVDTKAIWLGIASSFFVVMFLLNRLNPKFLIKFQYLVIFAILFNVGLWVISTYSGSLHKVKKLESVLNSKNFFNLRKVKAYEDVLSAFDLYPYMTYFGSGPGNFYSRASYQFFSGQYDVTKSTRASGKYKTSDSMGGVINRTDMDPFYLQFEKGRSIYDYHFMGTGQLDSPHSSYAGMLGEGGYLGFLTYISIYLYIFFQLLKQAKTHRKNFHIFPVILAAIGFMVFILTISAYNPWLETGRMTTLLWSMIAVVFLYDDRFRRQQAFMRRMLIQNVIQANQNSLDPVVQPSLVEGHLGNPHL